MDKYIIMWDTGYGMNAMIVDATDSDDAQMQAYEQWREDAESQADYKALPLKGNEDEAYNYGLIDDDGEEI